MGENVIRFPKQSAKSFMRHAKGNIYLLRWEERDDEGREPVFYFLLVPSAKAQAFENIAGKESFTLADYGHVVHWGYGEPDSDDLAKVQGGNF